MPAEQPALEEDEEHVQEIAEKADQQDRGPHGRELEGVLRDQQHVADAARAREVLREHHRDHGEGEAVAQARGDLRRGRGQHDPPDPRERPDPVRAGRVGQRRIDPAHAVDRVQEHGEEAEEADERDLLDVADRVEQDDRDRQQRRRRDRAPVLDVGHHPEPRPARQPERDPERDPDDSRDRVAEADPLEARDDVRAELREEPHVLERDQDRREPRELGRGGVRGPELPAEQEQERHRDLGADLERGVRPPAHAAPARCDGCQRSARRSTAVDRRWMRTPRKPVASA